MMHYNDPRLQVYQPNRLPRWLCSGATKEEIEAQYMAAWLVDNRPDLYDSARSLEQAVQDLSRIVTKGPKTKNERGVISRKVSVRNVEPPDAVVDHVDAALDALWLIMQEAYDSRVVEAVTPSVGEFFSSPHD